MSIEYHTLSKEAMNDSALSSDEILAMRQDVWSDGRINAEEAEAIFVQNDNMTERSAEWTDFFVEAICNYILNTSSPKGYVSSQQADWLISKIDKAGGVESMAELELIDYLFEHAKSVPENLKNYALAQIENAVLNGSGPTRDGGSLSPGMITASECQLLRRFIFSAGGDRPGAASLDEAELLFRLKDATIGQDNAPEWKQLFIQGVGNYLQGFSGHEQLNPARAAELEYFMNNTAHGVSGFFSRMAQANLKEGFGEAFNHSSEDYLDFDEQAAQSAQLTEREQVWLDKHLNADGQLDEFERALIEFLAEEQ